MILSLELRNFKSFKGNTIFSFEVNGKRRQNTFDKKSVVTMKDGTRIGRLAAIYGSNASGKTNLLFAFDFLRSFWGFEPQNKTIDIKNFHPFLLDDDSKNDSSEFILTFYVNQVKYIYTLIIKHKKVFSEVLVSDKKTIFRRDNDKIIFLDGYDTNDTQVAEIEIKCLSNMSFFAAFYQVNIIMIELETIIEWFRKSWLPIVLSDSEIFEYTKNLLYKTSDIKSEIIKYIQKADFNIEDIYINRKNINIPVHMKEDIEKDFVEAGIPVPEFFDYNASFYHKVRDKHGTTGRYSLSESSQSQGTIRMLGLSGAIACNYSDNTFLPIDEIESSLHPQLTKFIIKDFLTSNDCSQIIFTTHYDSFLDDRTIFRPEFIWFTNKLGDGSTELYSLAKFSGLKGIKSILKAYQYGDFGAVPNIGEIWNE